MYIRCFCFLCGQAAVRTAWVSLQLHVCVSMIIDALCECCLSAALHMKRAISLPLPDLGPPTTHRQQCPLPCLLDPEGHRTTKWVAGLTCPSRTARTTHTTRTTRTTRTAAAAQQQQHSSGQQQLAAATSISQQQSQQQQAAAAAISNSRKQQRPVGNDSVGPW